MMQTQMLFPMLAMVLLVFVVAGVMLKRRIQAMREKRINPQRVALSAQMAALIEDTRASDQYRNLFEAPVLFYAAMLTVTFAQITTPLLLVLAWLYVAARYVHAWIQCGTNRTMRRFWAFATSMTLLLTIWLLIAWQLLVPRI